MPETSQNIPSSLISRTTVAASTLKELSDNKSIPSIPYANVVAGASLLILERVGSVRSNKEQCAALVEHIDELLCIIIELCVEGSVTVSPALLDTVAKFAETLQKIEGFMRTQQDMGRLKRFFKQEENTAQLEECNEGLRQALEALSTKTNLAIIDDAAKMRADLQIKHEELLELLAETSLSDEGSGSARASVISSSTTNSSLSVLLPSAPQIFHGRESELMELITLLLQDSARVAILGPGGIGKTSLAKSAIHDSDVIAKYHDRWFVSCDSAETVEDLAFAIASALSLELSGRLSKKVVKYLSTKSNCLLVLDNFETPWEPAGSRLKVEEFLSVLADFPHVTLVVTMRGQERPEKIRWTRPFIAPLKPLHYDAAHKIFIDIADADSDEEAADVCELLSLTGNLPLAVTLMANVASFDGCASVVARWKTDDISLLSEGFDKMTNLETSLRLSLSSPRISSSPGALQLLSLLSLLPDGITDVDLFNSSCPISNIRQAKSTLLRTSLANVDGARLKVLAPVRELIRKLHPPPYAIVRPLRLHWDHFFMLWRTHQMPSGDLMQRLSGNTGNVTSILKYALEADKHDLKEVIYGIFYLAAFTGRIFGNHPLLMENIASHIEHADDNRLRGYHIWYLFNSQKVAPSEAPEMLAQGCRFFQLAGDLVGESRLQCIAASYHIRLGDANQASIHAALASSLADQADSDLRRYHALRVMASCKQVTGNFSEAMSLARRAQWFAGRIGNFSHETDALAQEAEACIRLGNFSQAAGICTRAQQLIIAAGLQGTASGIAILDLEGDIYLTKTAYLESRRALELLVRQTSNQNSPLFHANSLMTVASLDVALGVFKSKAEVVGALAVPRQIFTSHRYLRASPVCDKIVADFLITSGQTQEAVLLYEKSVGYFRREDVDFFSACLVKLGDITLRQEVRSTTHWATTCFACGKITANQAVIGWALRLLGDIFLKEGDDETSGALFQVALEEFTRMDIYLGKAQSLRRLAEIAERRGEYTVAAEQLSEARCMFLKSGLVGEAARIPLPVMVTGANVPGGTSPTEIVPEVEHATVHRIERKLIAA
ncbi:hypothetical protein C8R43DRAFT_1126715 [Mycena crocata]|nr:hypothetical protein C8R43DRAFT_1126715 [Mycena crocata]